MCLSASCWLALALVNRLSSAVLTALAALAAKTTVGNYGASRVSTKTTSGRVDEIFAPDAQEVLLRLDLDLADGCGHTDARCIIDFHHWYCVCFGVCITCALLKGTDL